MRATLINSAQKEIEHEPSTTKSEQAIVQFEVKDTGIGISADDLNKLFKAFVQTDSGRKSQQGTGLGLGISRQFVQFMGGEMTVKSKVGQSSLFQFYIPVEIGQATTMQKNRLARKAIALAPGQRNYKILVVDDRQSNRQLLRKLLQPLGF